MLGWISSHQCFFCSFWWCVDTEDYEEVASGHRSSPILVQCDASTNSVVEPSSITINNVDPNIAGMRVGNNNTRLCSGHQLAEDETILLIVTWIVHIPSLSILNTAMAGLRDPSQTIKDLWGCSEEPNADGGPHTRNVSPFIYNNTAGRCVKGAMTFNDPTIVYIVNHTDHAYYASHAQIVICGGCGYRSVVDMLLPAAENMIDDNTEQSDDDDVMQYPNGRCSPTMNNGFYMIEKKLRRRITTQQWHLEVNRYHALALIANYKQNVIANEDVVWQWQHDHIVDPPTPGSLANRNCTSCCASSK